jgi:hypothetical protein
MPLLSTVHIHMMINGLWIAQPAKNEPKRVKRGERKENSAQLWLRHREYCGAGGRCGLVEPVQCGFGKQTQFPISLYFYYMHFVFRLLKQIYFNLSDENGLSSAVGFLCV